MLARCAPGASLVGPRLWLPKEAFDVGWGDVGCNRLWCVQCGVWVDTEILKGQLFRSYRCPCQAQEVAGYRRLSAHAVKARASGAPWICGGHPPLALPHVLDGVALTETADYGELVARALVAPPFVAPGFKGTSFWVRRLYSVIPGEALKAKVGEAVAAQLWSDDADAVLAALEFYFSFPHAAGGEQLAQVGREDRERLVTLRDPEDPTESLYELFFEALNLRLAVHKLGLVEDVAAIGLAKDALLWGDASESTIYQVADTDPSWLSERAADIAAARRENLGYVLEALSIPPEDLRAETLCSLRQISPTSDRAVQSWARERGLRLPGLRAELA